MGLQFLQVVFLLLTGAPLESRKAERRRSLHFHAPVHVQETSWCMEEISFHHQCHYMKWFQYELKVDAVDSNVNEPLLNCKLLYIERAASGIENGFENIVGLETCTNGPLKRESDEYTDIVV